jgi:hypothetical protein
MGTALPSLVIAADWSTDEKKRWMVRAERIDLDAFVVYAPPVVGSVITGRLPEKSTKAFSPARSTCRMVGRRVRTQRS